MKKPSSRKSFFLFLLVFFILNIAEGQQNRSKEALLKVDSLVGGNHKDIFLTFFQLGLNNLIGNDKNLSFTGSPYSLLVKADSNYFSNENYKRYKVLRNFNFSTTLKIDSNYKFSGFSSGIKYAIVNKRDLGSSLIYHDLLLNDPHRKSISNIHKMYNDSISNMQDYEAKKSLISEGEDFFEKYSKSFNELSDQAKKIINHFSTKNERTKAFSELLSKNKNLKLDSINKNKVELYSNYIKQAPLWIIGISDTTYQDHLMFANVLLYTNYSVGIGKLGGNSNLELNAYSGIQYSDDSTSLKKDLKRIVWEIKPSLNFVLRSQNTQLSFFEFSVGAQYLKNLKGLYINEERNQLFADATLRFRLLKDFWIPIEIKYDPLNGRFFGFLNVRFNFNQLN